MKDKWLAALAALAITGCAGMHKQAAIGIVVATDEVADEVADDWHEQTDERIYECRSSAPEDADKAWRIACLDPYTPENTDKLIASVEAVIAIQLAVKAAAECEELKMCLDETDWKGLSEQAARAWSSLKPFVQITKGGK